MLIDERVSASVTVIKILYTVYIAMGRGEGQGERETDKGSEVLRRDSWLFSTAPFHPPFHRLTFHPVCLSLTVLSS